MDVLTPVITGSLLAVFTVVLGLLNKVQFDALKAQVDGVRIDLATFKAETGVRFDRVDRRLDRVDERFDRVDERFQRVDERFDRMDARIDEMRREAGALRAEFTQLALSLVPRPESQTG